MKLVVKSANSRLESAYSSADSGADSAIVSNSQQVGMGLKCCCFLLPYNSVL